MSSCDVLVDFRFCVTCRVDLAIALAAEVNSRPRHRFRRQSGRAGEDGADSLHRVLDAFARRELRRRPDFVREPVHTFRPLVLRRGGGFGRDGGRPIDEERTFLGVLRKPAIHAVAGMPFAASERQFAFELIAIAVRGHEVERFE
ncbi:hypothetical protein WJ40_34215 [Burkholderia cepacia]|nr:hypothetical protein WJ40_34215 [Burkholderia cepacia]